MAPTGSGADCRISDYWSPGRRRSWLLYRRVAAYLLSGHQFDADANDFELGESVAEGEQRMAAGEVGPKELAEAFHEAFMATLRNGKLRQ